MTPWSESRPWHTEAERWMADNPQGHPEPTPEEPAPPEAPPTDAELDQEGRDRYRAIADQDPHAPLDDYDEIEGDVA